MPKPLTVWITRNWKILKERKYQANLPVSWKTCTPSQEATIRTGHGKTDWFKIRKGAHQDYILSTCLFNFYGEHWYIMWRAGMHESQAGIKTAGRNINNLRYTDDTTLMTESEQELKSLLIKVKKESEKLAWNIQTKIMASGPITSWKIDGGKSGNRDRLYFLGLQNHCRWWLQPWN